MQKVDVKTKGMRISNCFGTGQVTSRKILGVLPLALLSLSGAAMAQLDNLQLTGVAPGNPALDGFYTSPYQVNINSAPVSTLVICDDFSTEVTVGEKWTATETSLATLTTASSPLTSLKFDNGAGQLSLQLTNYERAAYLAKELMTYQPNSFTDPAAEALSYAIWQVFDSGVQGYLASTLGTNSSTYKLIESDYQDAVTNANAGSLANVFAYTPAPVQGASQEYLFVQTPLNQVPEPATMLFGFALMGVVATARRRMVATA
jgi:hypothetical protein